MEHVNHRSLTSAQDMLG